MKGTITTSDFLPYGEYKRLLECLDAEKQYRWELYCALSFCLALRVSDILALRWCDVLDKKALVVREKKTRKVKPIPIGDSAGKRITEIYNLLYKPCVNGYIFTSPRCEGAWSRQYVNRRLKEWKDRYSLSVGRFSTHTFRKTFGRYVYESMGRTDEALILLCRIFRHTSIRTTQIYIGITDDEIGAVFSGIELPSVERVAVI